MRPVVRKDLIDTRPPFFQADIHDVIRREQPSFLARNPVGFCESPSESLAVLPKDREFWAQGSDAADLDCCESSILWRTAARVARSAESASPNTLAADCRLAVRSRRSPSEPQPESSTLRYPWFPRPSPVPLQRFQTGHESTIDTGDRWESLPSAAATPTMKWDA